MTNISTLSPQTKDLSGALSKISEQQPRPLCSYLAAPLPSVCSIRVVCHKNVLPQNERKKKHCLENRIRMPNVMEERTGLTRTSVNNIFSSRKAIFSFSYYFAHENVVDCCCFFWTLAKFYIRLTLYNLGLNATPQERMSGTQRRTPACFPAVSRHGEQQFNKKKHNKAGNGLRAKRPVSIIIWLAP